MFTISIKMLIGFYRNDIVFNFPFYSYMITNKLVKEKPSASKND